MLRPPDLHDLLIHSVVDYAIYMLDPEGFVVSWNPGAERIKGYAASEIVGEHFSRFYTEEDRIAGVPAAALATAAGTGRFTTEAWRLRKDGSRFWAMVVIDPIHQGGKLIGFAKITRDMTEQRNAQLAAENRELRAELDRLKPPAPRTGPVAPRLIEGQGPTPIAVARDPDIDGWAPLFNGKDLTVWKTHTDLPGAWRV